MRKRHAEIAGAGFTGLIAAAVLCQRGWSVRVHEASAEPRAFGAGIFLWQNGLHVLKAIGVYDSVVPKMHQAKRFEERDTDGALIASRKYPVPGGGRQWTMTRDDLYWPIMNTAVEAGAEICTNSKAVGATPEGELLMEDGRRLEGDLIIGADGIRSMVRDSLDLTQEHTQFPIGVIRLLVPRSEEEADSEKWNNYINFWQKSPFRRVLYAPCNKHDLYLMLAADFDDTEALQIPLNKRVWIDTFPHLEGILSRIGEDLRCDQYELLKLKTWSAGRVAIIGDAAHAMPPTTAQGVGSGMMNALALAVALDEFADVPTALSCWEEKERPMTEHTQEVSRQRVFNIAPSENNDRSKWEEGVLRTAHHLPTGAQT